MTLMFVQSTSILRIFILMQSLTNYILCLTEIGGINYGIADA